MANEVQVFNFENSEIRTTLIDGTPYFVGKDVANILGYKRTADAIASHVDSEDKGVGEIETPGGVQKLVVINESGLYSLVLSSKLPSAKKFKRWVTTDVLPDIRMHGAYLSNEKIEEILMDPETIISLAKQVKDERAKNALLTQQVAESRPKADYYDKIMQSKSLVTITQIAKDYGWSAKQMNDKLHELGVQYKIGGQWVLYSKYQDKGYTFSHTVDITKKDGSTDVKMNTKWTQKGRLFIYNLLKENDILPTIERED
ncbi:phage antirepressor KilAC domain-containing protein [Weissella paramesenteroides]|uniref:phage antirepressor KilAC domain-containing protein n=1 Tax=Weissella paramesenteroides TaxID=1249 RepID=UPI00123B0C56|nr:phage antirepressor [Weissella paramesenteroides]KAA8455275.1 phage antirepressor [Weissella paramesenteroides]KAA8456264.1 phage antirepressor [Weissella paramesenteroides]KAA8458245.1 phage antirepressor [Weissella paramesenteroides]KAA8460236.1 phage antirepressor [Weissella paramesenteroides]KAA8461578.1 phage antirepressor [Weissella paramesenteroides]